MEQLIKTLNCTFSTGEKAKVSLYFDEHFGYTCYIYVYDSSATLLDLLVRMFSADKYNDKYFSNFVRKVCTDEAYRRQYSTDVLVEQELNFSEKD